MSDFNIQFEEQDQSITLEFEQIGGGAVKSVNGKTGVVVLDAGDLEYDDTETYSSGSVGDELSTLKDGFDDLDDRVTALEEGGSGSGLTDDIKQALLQLASKVAYIDDQGQTYYDDLYDALYAVTAITINAQSIMLTSIGSTQQLTATTTPAGGTVTWASSNTSVATVSSTGLVTSTGYGSCTVTASSGSVSATCAVAVSQVTLTSISADYQQSGTVYDTASLDSLKSDLTVTATYSDSSTATVTEYTLSGTLTVGTSTVTVSYGGKTTTFNVTVTAAPTLSSISAVYTQSGTVYDTDSLDSLKSDLAVTAHMSDSSTRTVTTYTLSGTLTEGTSTVTVSFGGKTTTFNVTVKASSVPVFVNHVSTDFSETYPSLYKIVYGQGRSRSYIASAVGQHPVNHKAESEDKSITVYPIPLKDITSIKISSIDSFELEVLKYVNDDWYAYNSWYWKNSGDTIDVSQYANSDYYYAILIRNVGATAENTTIEVTRG